MNLNDKSVKIAGKTYILNISLTVWGPISHLNGFEILTLFYILYDRLSDVSDWT